MKNKKPHRGGSSYKVVQIPAVHWLAALVILSAVYVALVESRLTPLMIGLALATAMEVAWVYFEARR